MVAYARSMTSPAGVRFGFDLLPTGIQSNSPRCRAEMVSSKNRAQIETEAAIIDLATATIKQADLFLSVKSDYLSKVKSSTTDLSFRF